MTTPVKEKRFESDEATKIPRPFVMRRFHSLLGLWLTIYLTEHLLVNSQAAFFFQDENSGFVRAVNRIHEIPYLKEVEILFLALPFFIHGVWGLYYAWTAKLNAHRTDGSQPALAQYPRNRAFSWQRMTAWILVVAILAHVIHMRFMNYPAHVFKGGQASYLIRLHYDPGLPLAAQKLAATLYNSTELETMKQKLVQREQQLTEYQKEQPISSASYLPEENPYFHQRNQIEEEKVWLQVATKKKLKPNQVIAATPTPGGAFYLIVREAFKSLTLVILYSLFVLAAAFHGFNGLWTFCIKWGITLTRRSQKRMRTLSTCLMGIVMILGLMSAWGTYWTTHRSQNIESR